MTVRALGPMLLPDAVGTSTVPLISDRDATSKGSETLITTYGSRAVVVARSGVESTARVDDVGLNVRSTTSEELTSLNGGTSDNGGPLVYTRAPTSIVRRVTSRTKEELSDTTDLRLPNLVSNALKNNY